MNRNQIFSIAFILIMIANFIAKHFFHSSYLILDRVFDGMMVGLLILWIIFFSRTYIMAWFNNKREEANP